MSIRGMWDVWGTCWGYYGGPSRDNSRDYLRVFITPEKPQKAQSLENKLRDWWSLLIIIVLGKKFFRVRHLGGGGIWGHLGDYRGKTQSVEKIN